MVADLLEPLNNPERVLDVALRRGHAISLSNNMFIHALLRRCQFAAHDLGQFGRQVLGVQPVHASDDEVVTQIGELLLARLAELLLFVRRVRFPSSQNGALVVLRELVLRAEDCARGTRRRRRSLAVAATASRDVTKALAVPRRGPNRPRIEN